MTRPRQDSEINAHAAAPHRIAPQGPSANLPLRLATIRGIPIRADPGWWLISALLIWSLSSGYFPAQLPELGQGATLLLSGLAVVGLLISLVLHELSHALVAQSRGLKIRAITLFLFGGVAELEREPREALTELRVAIAGPMASIALAGLFWVLAQLVSGAAQALFAYLYLINLILGLFNLLPAFPLDGGRVYRALLWFRSGDMLDATRRAARLGSAAALGLIVLGLFALFGGAAWAGVWPILLGIYLFAASRQSYRQILMRHVLEGRTVLDLMSRDVLTASPDQTLSHLVDRIFLENSVSFTPVVEAGVPIGYIDLGLVNGIDRENWGTTTVGDVFEEVARDAVVSPNMPAPELMERVSASGRRKFMVMSNGDLKGVVTLSDLVAFLDVALQIARDGHDQSTPTSH